MSNPGDNPPFFNSVSISSCTCNNRVIYIVGNYFQGDGMKFIDFNVSQCQTYDAKDAGAFLFCNFNSLFEYSNFHNNEGKKYLVSLEQTDASKSITGTMNSCNFINNKVADDNKHLIFITHQTFTFSNCLFKEDLTKYNLFLFSGKGKAHLQECDIVFSTGTEVITEEECPTTY